jgi:oligopeptide/dipeptide ABC transporter ATP-binding protein
MAMSCSPSLLIADEPTTALDVTIQAQVLELIENLKEEFKAAILFITHDLGVIADIADDVAVMYLGKIVEIGAVSDIFHQPKHPYTIGLMNCIPTLVTKKETRLMPIEGTIPDLRDLPKGCSFSSRCREANETCLEEIPLLTEVSAGHKVACWNASK